MAIAIDAFSRDRQSATADTSFSVVAGTPTETDNPAGGEESYFQPYEVENLDPPAVVVASVTTVNASANISTTNDGFAEVQVGDDVAGTGIPASTTVLSKTDNNNIVLSQAATAAGTVSVTFDPFGGNTISPTLYAIEVRYTRSATAGKLLTAIIMHKYDGSLGATPGTAANSTSQETLISSATGQTPEIDVDSFLTQLRVPRTA